MNGPAAILLLAAGAARRMRGADKLLEPVAGEPLLRRQARAALASGLPVLVALPPDRPARAAALKGLALAHITVADPGEGMAASLRAGIEALPPGTGAIIVMLADMPEITGEDLSALAAAWAADPARPHRLAGPDGAPGHPVILPAALFPALRGLRGDAGARGLLAGRDVGLLPCPDDRALTDLDTPEAWAAWHARTGL